MVVIEFNDEQIVFPTPDGKKLNIECILPGNYNTYCHLKDERKLNMSVPICKTYLWKKFIGIFVCQK